MDKDKNAAVLLWTIYAVMIALLFIFGPLLTILALNTLFSTSIPYNIATWAASLWLTMIFAGSRIK